MVVVVATGTQVLGAQGCDAVSFQLREGVVRGQLLVPYLCRVATLLQDRKWVGSKRNMIVITVVGGLASLLIGRIAHY